jgi:hypothetical protein
MYGLWQFRNASGRVLLLLGFALFVRYCIAPVAIEWGLEKDGLTGRPDATQFGSELREVTPTPSGEPLPGAQTQGGGVAHDVEDAIATTAIPKIRLDGGVPDEALVSPFEAAIGFGGMVLMIGGVGATSASRRRSRRVARAARPSGRSSA